MELQPLEHTKIHCKHLQPSTTVCHIVTHSKHKRCCHNWVRAWVTHINYDINPLRPLFRKLWPNSPPEGNITFSTTNVIFQHPARDPPALTLAQTPQISAKPNGPCHPSMTLSDCRGEPRASGPQRSWRPSSSKSPLGNTRSSHETTRLISTSLPPGIQGSRMTQEMSSITFLYYVSDWESRSNVMSNVIYSWQNKTQQMLYSSYQGKTWRVPPRILNEILSSDDLEKYFCVSWAQ